MKIDICFILDCTASMGVWIAEAKQKTVEMVTDICTANPDAEVQVAFVGYRDYSDLKKIEVIGFTTPEEAQVAIQWLEAEGGGDEAEDVATALFTALHLNWTGEMKFIIHIADAPAHGLDFHTPDVSDQFPRGDPNGRDPRDSVEKFSFLNMNYTFIKMSQDTDMMIREFEKCYTQGGAFTVLNLVPQKTIGDGSARLSESVSRHVSDSIRRRTSSPEM